ncbi:GNAT family N-acetyltransferase [Glycomyces paridis]|uniref:GNAT family N-acetyltransferase n=1 Tax=Glycomyces paridis TaxID=2126555 RepID=A0A4S8P423_9ACTN|nr:GNAT family protein [Glycomyces paridis]THV23592.1 GNAT family N-acetyltransferase [Glycomyces paridis]
MRAQPNIALRPITTDDAPTIAAIRRDSRDHLAPWEPARGDDAHTDESALASIKAALERTAAGTGRSYVITDHARIVGGILINSLVQGPYFRSCSIGYWVARTDTGRGVATEAVRLVKDIAFGELELQRVQAETLVHNHASQKVLERNGFTLIGLAPSYLKIAGTWQDHLLYQALPKD